jgi:hypothetical protein
VSNHEVSREACPPTASSIRGLMRRCLAGAADRQVFLLTSGQASQNTLQHLRQRSTLRVGIMGSPWPWDWPRLRRGLVKVGCGLPAGKQQKSPPSGSLVDIRDKPGSDRFRREQENFQLFFHANRVTVASRRPRVQATFSAACQRTRKTGS